MSGAGQVQAQIDLAVSTALAPVLAGMAALTERVAELESQLSPAKARVTSAPAKKAVQARAGTATATAEARGSK